MEFDEQPDCEKQGWVEKCRRLCFWAEEKQTGRFEQESKTGKEKK